MALTIESGAGDAAAEAYSSVADADLYFSNRGNAAWAALATLAKEQALRKGCDYLLQTYRTRWAGRRVNTTQALDWPRYWALRIDSYGGALGSLANYYASNAVPDEVKRANMDLALRASTGDLLADLGQKVLSKTIGPISTTYDGGSPQYARYPSVDRLLAPLLRTSAGMMLTRA